MTRKPNRKTEDPFLRPCTACGARKGEACRSVGKDGRPLVSRATRLVHADRIEQLHPGATDA